MFISVRLPMVPTRVKQIQSTACDRNLCHVNVAAKAGSEASEEEIFYFI
jgi:hypothetical protein